MCRLRVVWFVLGGCVAVGGLVLPTARGQTPEYRAFWVDAWGAGFRSASEVETLLGIPGTSVGGEIRAANCNTVVVEVRRRADVCYPSAMGEPYFSGLSPSNFNALQAMIDAAHDTTGGKQRIDVHAWVVTFATSSGSTTSPVYYDHNDPADADNYWVTLNNYGNETSDKAFDPGHPRCLEYLVNVCMDLVENFDIDGLHYDYIRFTGDTQGYNPTSIARFNEWYNRTGQPGPSDSDFEQWRRDQVTALVRQVYARIQAVKPWVKQSGAFVTWNPSPSDSTRSAFMGTRPYYQVYSDWDSWVQEGIVDIAVPMTYYNWASLPYDYLRWMNFEKDRKRNRHMVVGPGIYLNSRSNAIYEIQMTRDPSPAGNYADGFCGYSYRVPYNGGTWASFRPQLVSQVTPSPAPIPDMPWKSNPTKGHISGTVTYADTGAWADGAQVSIDGVEYRTMKCDGTGYYAFIDLMPGSYLMTVTADGYPSVVTTVSVAVGQVTGNMYVRDVALGADGLIVSDVEATNITTDGATITWTTNEPSDSRVYYGLSPHYNWNDYDATVVTQHSLTVAGLAPVTEYHFKVVSSDGTQTTHSPDYTFTTLSDVPELVIDNADAGWTNTSPSGGWSVGSIPDVPKIGSNYLYTSGVGNTDPGAATRSCRWTPTIVEAGYYDVYVYYQLGANRTSSAPYTVVHRDGTLTQIEDQYSETPNQGGWFLLGAGLPFEAGTSGYVSLANNTADTALVSADAAKFVLVGHFTVPSDFDGDGDVDLADYAEFLGCYSGPGEPFPQPSCDGADFDGDGDVDLSDYGAFLGCFNGPGHPAACL